MLCINLKHVVLHRGTGYFEKYLTIEQDDGTGNYLWKVDGQFRTVTTDHPVIRDTNSTLALNAKYAIKCRPIKGETVTGINSLLNGVGE